MKIRLIILLVYSVILQTGITDSTCPRGGYRNEQPQFGPRCMYKCNCKNKSEQCEEVSGQCTSGCADGWMGPGCQYGDVAFRKPATQSSTGDTQMSNSPSSVVDGNYSTCSNVTKGTYGIWWKVDLGKKYTITGLVITMHETYYFHPYQVEIMNSSVSSGRYCNSNGGFTPTNREIEISCTEDIYGSMVKISSLGSLTWAMLCDLRIFGGRTLAYRRNSTQSSTRYATGDKTDGWAELGVDGGTSLNFFDGSCTHTNQTVSPWWRVDLARLSGFTIKFWVISTATTVYNAPNTNPGLYIVVTDFSSSLGESISIELNDTNSNPRVLNLCEVFVFGDCLVNQCGWECEKSCYCKSAIVGSDKIEGICPDEDCLGNWTGTNHRCDYCLLDAEGKCPQRCHKCGTGSYCFPETATCLPICNEREWGLNCSNFCGKCISGDKCNQITGRCPGQCQVGWWDKNCSSSCSFCKNGTKCEKNSGKCEICEDGKWGDKCDKTCGNCMNRKCNITFGVCEDVCMSGWWDGFCNQSCDYCATGTKCDKDSGKCEICEDGKWGDKCDKTCGNCMNRKCNVTFGVCEDVCMSGWWDGFCNQSCAYCENGTMCEQESGKCKQCPTGKWNRKCSQNCTYCARDTECDIDSGECKWCPNGRWGSRCSQNCTYCAQDTECNIGSGECKRCPDGRWGSRCNQSCESCAQGTECDISNGNCLKCDAGSWSLNCSLKCGQCFGDGVCDIKTAQCIHGCLPGWQGDNCTIECSAGWFGTNCQFECGHCEVNTTCDKGSGACPGLCLDSFLPPYCIDRNDEKMTPDVTNTGVVIGVSIGTVLTSCLLVVIVVFLVLRKRRENLLKNKMREKTIQQPEDGTSIIYTTLIRSHEEHTPGYSEHEYGHVIHTNSSTDTNIGRRHEVKYGLDTDHENNLMTQSSKPEKDVYYNGVEVTQIQIPLANLPDYIESKASDSKVLESDVEVF